MGEWKEIKLKEVLSEVTERNKDERVKNVLSVTNAQGFVKQEEYFEGTVHSQNISNYKIVRKNQFAYNPSRVNVGSIDILATYDEGVLSPMYVVFEVDNTKLLPKYFKYYFQTHKFVENVKNNTQGSVRNSLSFKALASFEYLLPSIEEQEKIVEILGKVEKIEKKLEAEIKLVDILKRNYTKLLLNNEKIENTQWVKLNEITSVITKGTTAKKFINKGIKFIKIEALDGRNILNEKCSYITEEEHNGVLKRSILKENDILFAIAGATIGKCAIVKKENLPANTNQALAIIRLKESINKEYILKVLESDIMKRYISLNLTAGAQPNLNLAQIGNFKIPILEEIDINKFLNCINLYERKIELLNAKRKEVINLKNILMQKLLTGKVKVKI